MRHASRMNKRGIYYGMLFALPFWAVVIAIVYVVFVRP